MALPGGWINTGLTTTVSVTCDLYLRAMAGIGGGIVYNEPISVEQFRVFAVGTGANLGCTGLGYGLTSYAGIEVYAWDDTSEPYPGTLLQSAAGSCTPTWLPATPITATYGPAIIGVTLRQLVDGTQALVYRLFPDTGCTYSLDVGLRHFETLAYGYPGFGYRRCNLATGNYGVWPRTPNTMAKIANVRWGAESGPALFDEWDCGYDYYGTAGPSITVLPPLHYTADLHVIDANNSEPAHDVLVGGKFTQANGTSAAHTHWVGYGESAAVGAALDGDWTTAGVTPPAADTTLDVVEVNPKTPETPESWTPATLTLDGSLSVLRSTNAWIPQGWMDVSGSTWTTHEAGCAVSRALLSYWREWNTVGHPKYHADDGLTTTKADYYGADGQDIWGWGLYAFLDVDLTAPSDGSVTLAVTSAVAPNAGTVADTFVRRYPVPATSGRHTYRVDLLFPTEGGPWYAERVESVAFEGLGVGEYTLHSLTLVLDQDAYLKLSSNGLTLAVDGSFATAFWGTDTWIPATSSWQKDHQNGLFTTDGGPMSYGGATGLTSMTLAQAAAHWNRMEGVTAAYDGAAMEADLTDGVNTIGTDAGGAPLAVTRKAQWLADVIPHGRVAKDTPSALAASIRCTSIELCPAPADTFVLTFRKSLGTVLEAQTRTNDRKRGAAGVTIKAYRDPGHVEIGSGVSDVSGFVTLGIPNGTVSGADFTATLESV